MPKTYNKRIHAKECPKDGVKVGPNGGVYVITRSGRKRYIRSQSKCARGARNHWEKRTNQMNQ
jgi:hypothetical protein